MHQDSDPFCQIFDPPRASQKTVPFFKSQKSSFFTTYALLFIAGIAHIAIFVFDNGQLYNSLDVLFLSADCDRTFHLTTFM